METEQNRSGNYSDICKRLMQGIIYKEDNEKLWDSLKINLKTVSSYFNEIGIIVKYSDEYSLCYLSERDDLDEDNSDEENISKLIPKKKFTYLESLILIYLRQYLEQHNNLGNYEDKCIITLNEIYNQIKHSMPNSENESQQMKFIKRKCMNELINTGYVKKEKSDDENIKYEIRRIIIFKITLDKLREFEEELKNE